MNKSEMTKEIKSLIKKLNENQLDKFIIYLKQLKADEQSNK